MARAEGVHKLSMSEAILAGVVWLERLPGLHLLMGSTPFMRSCWRPGPAHSAMARPGAALAVGTGCMPPFLPHLVAPEISGAALLQAPRRTSFEEHCVSISSGGCRPPFSRPGGHGDRGPDVATSMSGASELMCSVAVMAMILPPGSFAAGLMQDLSDRPIVAAAVDEGAGLQGFWSFSLPTA